MQDEENTQDVKVEEADTSDIIPFDETPPAPIHTQQQVATSPDNLLQLALEKGTDIEQLERLMDLKERHDTKIARAEFYDALSMFQRNCPSIPKTKQGHNYMYAPLDSIVKAIRGHLADCGLSYRFEQEHADSITITCIVTHRMGHSESNKMSAQPDATGSKNAVQAVASTVSYLQRYTLIGALGITTADEDDDGESSQESQLSDKAEDWIAKVVNAQSLEQLETDYRAGYKDLDGDGFGRNQLIKAKDAAKKRLKQG